MASAAVISLGGQSATGCAEQDGNAIVLVLDDPPAERAAVVPEPIVGDDHGLPNQARDRCPLLWCQVFDVVH